MTFPKGGSEYGGYPGPYQPAPHDVADVPYEQLNLATQTDPSDEESSVETVLEAHRAEARKRLNES